MADLAVLEVGGRDHLQISTDALRLELVPALGGTVVSLRRRGCGDTPDGPELLWRPPWGLRPAGAAPLAGSAADVTTDGLVGGWSSLFPNGSEVAVVDGADWPAGGEARLAWCSWDREADSVVLRTRLLRSPFELVKRVTARDDEVVVEETVSNVGGQHVDVVWGSQLHLAAALLGPRTRFDASAALVRPDARQTPSAGYDDLLPWPRAYTADGMVNLHSLPEPGVAVTRIAYLADFSSGSASLTAPDIGVRLELGWEGDVWPYLWYQLETGARTGYPWWGRGHQLTLTAASSWPAAGINEIRRVSATSLRIQPGSSRTAVVRLRVADC